MTTMGSEEAAWRGKGLAASMTASTGLSRMGNPPPAGNALTQRPLVYMQRLRGEVRRAPSRFNLGSPSRVQTNVRKNPMSTPWRRAAGLALALALAAPAGAASGRPNATAPADDAALLVHALHPLPLAPPPA